ncbi:hypothetical protein OHT77_22175 [Streptomyces sp. NBC_00252]|uniref:hypothetical protein n=1 Tax=Streptomyces sp. NBC_00252 TaxID=2975691 RepID=UPI002E2DE12A|nr:hypothetical protein [Streptomyces sp. NBC_00252]
MGEQEFDKLLDSMPRIAESINAFASKEVQKQAFEALVGALNISPVGISGVNHESSTENGNVPNAGTALSEALTENTQGGEDSESAPEPTSTEKRRRKVKPRRNWTAVKDIGFRPEGKVSFKEFIEEKQPATIDQKGLLAVYYFEQVLELDEIGVGHVMAAYKEAVWRNPSNPENALQGTSSRHHWLDTSNMRIIKTTQRGRDFVEHDLPAQKK